MIINIILWVIMLFLFSDAINQTKALEKRIKRKDQVIKEYKHENKKITYELEQMTLLKDSYGKALDVYTTIEKGELNENK